MSSEKYIGKKREGGLHKRSNRGAVIFTTALRNTAKDFKRRRTLRYVYCKDAQCCGSASGCNGVPESVSGSRRAKMAHKMEKS